MSATIPSMVSDGRGRMHNQTKKSRRDEIVWLFGANDFFASMHDDEARYLYLSYDIALPA